MEAGRKRGGKGEKREGRAEAGKGWKVQDTMPAERARVRPNRKTRLGELVETILTPFWFLSERYVFKMPLFGQIRTFLSKVLDGLEGLPSNAISSSASRAEQASAGVRGGCGRRWFAG